MTRGHYSYTHYANRDVAEGFDALRFGGPIGRHLAEAQSAILHEAFAPLPGRWIVDVGAGTGRAAVDLASGGARVVALDASAEMLGVARQRAGEAGVDLCLGRGDAQALPLPDRSVDGAVSLRVLMHTVDWRRSVRELCRVARWRVVVDFPSARSVAALESGGRRMAARLGQNVEAYRVLREADVRTVFAEAGYRIVLVRRQFVLPINLHKKLGSLTTTVRAERALAAAGLLRLFGSPVTVVAER